MIDAIYEFASANSADAVSRSITNPAWLIRWMDGGIARQIQTTVLGGNVIVSFSAWHDDVQLAKRRSGGNPNYRRLERPVNLDALRVVLDDARHEVSGLQPFDLNMESSLKR